jgi:hypothetical protein
MVHLRISKGGSSSVSDLGETIRRHVAALTERQNAFDEHMHKTFEAVYATIEQVVDRLSRIQPSVGYPPSR